LKAFAPGIYPRSEALVQATRDLDRGRTTEHAVAEQVDRDFRELVGVQEEAGLDLVSDGMLRWQDHFRLLAEASDGLDARPLTRFLDTNTFYRALLVEGEPRLRTPLPAPDLPAGRWLATLPSPYALARAADGRAGAKALAANVLAPQIEAWSDAGCALVVLSEPFLARTGDADEALVALAELPTSVPLALQLVFGDASRVLDDLVDAPLAAVGVDFYSTPLEAVPEDYPRELLAGVVDARSSALEDVAEIGSFVERLAERNPSGIALVPNGDLQFVPETIARQKLACLGRARAMRVEAGGVRA
jgi:5-methyltetrahydropteroyltriglutamate--homocysteine methyltransferase